MPLEKLHGQVKTGQTFLVPLPARTIGTAGNTIKNGWDKQLSISVDPAFGLSASGTSTDINLYISSATVSEFPSFNWPHTDEYDTHMVDMNYLLLVYNPKYYIFYIKETEQFGGTKL